MILLNFRRIDNASGGIVRESHGVEATGCNGNTCSTSESTLTLPVAIQQSTVEFGCSCRWRSVLGPASSDERNSRSNSLPICTSDTRRTPMTNRFTYECNHVFRRPRRNVVKIHQIQLSPLLLPDGSNYVEAYKTKNHSVPSMRGEPMLLFLCTATIPAVSHHISRHYNLGVSKSFTHPIQQMKEARESFPPCPRPGVTTLRERSRSLRESLFRGIGHLSSLRG